MCKKPTPGKYYSVKANPDLKTLMCMSKEVTNTYDVDPTGYNLVHVGDSTKEEVLMHERLIRDGFKVLVVEGVPPVLCGLPGQKKCV